MIEPNAIYNPKLGEILVVTGETDGRTAQWLLEVEDTTWRPGTGHGVTLVGHITAAKLNLTTDLLRANQKASINRLLKHLKHHCPALGEVKGLDQIFGKCDYKEGPTE